MKSLVDRNAKGYVEQDGVTDPDINAEPWISPLITLKLIASDDANVRHLKFSWELDSITQNLITLRLTFATPMKISQNSVPEKLYIELRIQQYLDADGFGVPH